MPNKGKFFYAGIRLEEDGTPVPDEGDLEENDIEDDESEDIDWEAPKAP